MPCTEDTDVRERSGILELARRLSSYCVWRKCLLLVYGGEGGVQGVDLGEDKVQRGF